MKRCRPVLGTYVAIEVTTLESGGSVDDVTALAAIDAAFAAIERVETSMSFHREESDLARLNRAAPGSLLTLDTWTVEVLQLAAELQRATDGVFDCAVGAELIAMELLPGAATSRGSGSLLDDVTVIDTAHVRLNAPVCLDLGGIAKGDAVDRAVATLRAYGVTQGLVNAGGDMRILGDKPREVFVRLPGRPGQMRFAGMLADGAIATSSTAYTGGHDDRGNWRSSLVDPRTRKSVMSSRSYSVLADRCAVADGLTKVLAITDCVDHASLRRYEATALVI